MYDCVIPAAGASSRMGRWKPGLPFRAGTLLSAAAASARGAGCRVLVVAGNNADRIEEALCLGPSPEGAPFPPVEVVRNPRWASGMMGSLQAGMAAVRTSMFFVLLADMPLVPSSTFRDLAREAEARTAAGLPESPLFPSFGGRTGHPVLAPSRLIPEARALPPDGRLKVFLALYSPVHVGVGHPGILVDLDTREDYERVRAFPFA